MARHEWNRNNCRFLVGDKQCDVRANHSAFFCDTHQGQFNSVSNSNLLEELTRLMVGGLEVKNGKITALPWQEWDKYVNTWHALIQRGYTADKLTRYSADIIKKHDLFQHIDRKMGRTPKWRKFENLVAALHVLKAEGADIVFDERITGRRSGGIRQVDVGVHFKHGFYDYFVAVECKHYSKEITIDKVESFVTKLSDIQADKGVMVTQKGFQKGAIETARSHNILLYSLKEEFTNWTKEITGIVGRYPFPVSIDFDTPQKFTHSGDTSYGIHEFLIQEGVGIQPISALEFILKHLEQVPANIPLPFTLEIDLISSNNPHFIRFPRQSSFTPLRAIKIVLDTIGVLEDQRELDAPPRLDSYIYQDLTHGTSEKIPAVILEDILKELNSPA